MGNFNPYLGRSQRLDPDVAREEAAQPGGSSPALPVIEDTTTLSVRGYLVTIDWHFCWTGHEEYVLDKVTTCDSPEGDLLPILSDKFKQDCIDAVRADHLKLLSGAEGFRQPHLAKFIERRFAQLPLVGQAERRRALTELEQNDAIIDGDWPIPGLRA